MRRLFQFLVVAVTVLTLTLGAAVGVSAGSGHFGNSGNHEQGNHEGQCRQHGEHENATPGHENCGDKGDNGDNGDKERGHERS